MSDRVLSILAILWFGYAAFLVWHFFHPSYNWTNKELIREHIYDYQK